MKFLSLNLHSIIDVKDLSKNWQQRFAEILNKILVEKYDVIAFQEVNQVIGGTPVPEEKLNQVGYISSNYEQIIRDDNFAFQLAQCLNSAGLKYQWTYNFAHIGYDKYEEGTAIFSLAPVKLVKALPTSNPESKGKWTYRVQSGMKIQGKKQIFWIFSVHFGWWQNSEFPEETFKNQWMKFEKGVKPLEDKLVIAMGDFNNPPQIHNQGYDFLIKDRKWYDACVDEKGNTPEYFYTVQDEIDGWENESSAGRRLDLAITNKKIQMKEPKICFNGKNGGIVSDHCGFEGFLDL